MAVWNSHIHEGNSACFLGRKVEPDGFVSLFGFSRRQLGDGCCVGTAATACQGRGILLNLQTSCRKCSNPSRGLAPGWAGRHGQPRSHLACRSCGLRLPYYARLLNLNVRMCPIITATTNSLPAGHLAGPWTLEDSRSHCRQLDAIRFWVMVGS